VHYKIVGVNGQNPEEPVVVFGEFAEKDNEHPIISALVTEYGDLNEWTGGNWMDAWVNENDDVENEFTLSVNEWDYYVYIDHEPFNEQVEPYLPVSRERWVLYDHDQDRLITTNAYTDMGEAQDDADQFDNVMVVKLQIG